MRPWRLRCRRIQFERLRQTEVQHLNGAIRSQLDVRGLQVPVDDALLVRRFQGFGDLPRDRQRFIQWNRSSGDALGKRGPIDQLDDERGCAIALLQTVNLRDVRMIEPGEDFGFTLEARQPVDVRCQRVTGGP